MTIKGYIKTINADTGAITVDSNAFIYSSDEQGNAITSGQGGAAVYADVNGYFALMPTSRPIAITVMRKGDTKQTAQKFVNITDVWENRINVLNRTTPKTGSNTNTSTTSSSKKTATTILYIAAVALGILTGLKTNNKKNG